MSASLPPAAAETGDRASDFGSSEFWRPRVASMAPPSMPPESRAPVIVLSAEQQARRRKFQRLVTYVVGGALLFTAVAALAHFAFGKRELEPGPDSVSSAVHAAAPAAPAASALAAQTSSGANPSPLSAAPHEGNAGANAAWRDFIKSPSVDPSALEAWSSAAATLNSNDVAEARKQLTRKTNMGPRSQREAAGLGLAILWRAQSHPAEARKILTRLAKHGADRSVRDYAGKMLAQG